MALETSKLDTYISDSEKASRRYGWFGILLILGAAAFAILALNAASPIISKTVIAADRKTISSEGSESGLYAIMAIAILMCIAGFICLFVSRNAYNMGDKYRAEVISTRDLNHVIEKYGEPSQKDNETMELTTTEGKKYTKECYSVHKELYRKLLDRSDR